MPRLKRKSVKQRAEEAKKAYKIKKQCREANETTTVEKKRNIDRDGVGQRAVGSALKRRNRVRGKKRNAGADECELTNVVSAERAEALVSNVSTTAEHENLVINASSTVEREELVIYTRTPSEQLHNRLRKITLNSPQAPLLPANERLPDVIVEHLQVVEAIVGSEIGEASFRDLLDPVGWLDAQTIYAFLESVAPTAAISTIIVQPFIWMLRVGNAESIPPYRYVRHYIRNYTDDWELLLVPIVLPGHHVVGAYRRSTKLFQYYDSLRNPMSEETRSAVTDMLDVLHPGAEHIFVNSTEVVEQHDGSSCGVIACYTAHQLMADRPTYDIAFDSSRFRQFIYNKITTRIDERDRFGVADITPTMGIPETKTTRSGRLIDHGSAKVTPSSMSRARSTKRRGGSVDGSETPKRKPARKSTRYTVTTGNGVRSALQKSFRAASAMYMRFHEIFQNAVRARDHEGRTDEPFIRMRIVNVSEASAADKAGIHPGRLNAPTSGQVMAVFDADDDGAPPDPRSRG
ncbi:unnamed protein product, partial [Toxocara canis]|uniref:ULP_PROTEASE domain-containing protein n=1 Tax=Toxocara canis TaxID=6265 RepID=A0A183VDU0_TOXCA